MPLDPALAKVAAELGLELPNLEAAAELTATKLADAQRTLVRELGPASKAGPGLDLVVVGSAARGEMTPGSDFDYLIIGHQLVKEAADIQRFRHAADQARTETGAGRPGATGTFGPRLVAASDLVDRIGLEEDSNRNMTHRILVLEESRSLYDQEAHTNLVRVILSRYLHEHEAALRDVPRFLLNDMVRYWRTIAVDYQAKRWQDGLDRAGWGLRYLKLRVSRKLTFAGNVSAVFLPTLSGVPTTPEALISTFQQPSLARLAGLLPHLPDEQSRAGLATSLRIAEEFTGQLADESFRREMAEVSSAADADASKAFAAARARSKELQSSLESVFFASGRLGELSRKYLSF